MNEQIEDRPRDWRWRIPFGWWLEVRRRGGRRYSKRWSWYQDLTPELARLGIEIRRFRVDTKRFWHWTEVCGYRRMDYYDGGQQPTAINKWLEHFVSLELTAPRAGERLIDVASRASPFPDIARQHYRLEVFRQDLTYPEGIHGDQIGGNAAAMPVADGFADIMTLHCSFDHFEGDADSRFLREADRVLRPGGRVCILPFYTHKRYSIQSDPETWQDRSVSFDQEALICLARGWGETHGRSYDAERVASRILPYLGDLEPVVYAVENLDEIHPDVYLKFALLLTRP